MQNGITNNDFYFCYSYALHDQLKRAGFSYILTAYHISTHRQFWLYERTDELHNELAEYSITKIQDKITPTEYQKDR